jgi:membrane-associated protease RseP (regulator of RpoE activity)
VGGQERLESSPAGHEGQAMQAPNESAHALAEAISSVFAVESITTSRASERAIQLEGQLLTDSERAYAHIAERFKALGYTPLLRRQNERIVVIALPGLFARRTKRDYAAIALFALTALSVLFASTAAQAPDWEWVLRHPLAGLPFAASLLGILLAHEMGHYWMARHVGVAASLPYFIPMPLSLFGTMGAIIRTRSPMRSRRQLLALGAAGPLAGMVVAVPILIVGLLRSQVQPIPAQPGLLIEGNSLLYAGLKLLLFGRLLPSGGYDVFLDPVAFAAWAGLLLTSVNLIPAGQLDGGHIAYALLGNRAKWLNRLAVFATAALGLVWSGWFIWTALLLVFGQRNAQPLDDITPLRAREKVLAICMLITFALLFTPIPMTIL